MNNKNIVINTRFAPSPSGYLHIGGLRTAIFAWIYAKKFHGKFFLRIEDTDKTRLNSKYYNSIIESLSWIGIKYDDKVFFQSHRLQRHIDVINHLLNTGQAYRCYCSTSRLARLRNYQTLMHKKPRYDGYCRKLSDNNILKKHNSYVVRFKNPYNGFVEWKDLIKGNIKFSNNELDDLIIMRSNGTPTYNLCSVVDDIDMNITHVIRGDDHVNNTPRQINLYNSLKCKLPEFAHVPMIVNTSGKKLSKRDDTAVNVLYYKEEGYLPHAMINYLIRLGWSYGNKEIFSLQDIVKFFDLQAINKSSAIFDINKLQWLNKFYMKSLSMSKVSKYLDYHFKSENIDVLNGPSYDEIIPVMVNRVKTLKSLLQDSKYFYTDFDQYNKDAFSKYCINKYIKHIEYILSNLKQLPDLYWNDNHYLYEFLKSLSLKIHFDVKIVIMIIRVAITGSDKSPDIGTTLKLIGKKRVISRLKKVISIIYQNNK